MGHSRRWNGRRVIERLERAWHFLVSAEEGVEPMEYLLITAFVILPLMVAVRLMWEVLIRYFEIISFTIDMPFF